MCNCPKCGRSLTGVNVDRMDLVVDGGNSEGVAYTCPWCNTILGVAPDPAALTEEIVAAVVRALKR